MVRSVAGSTAPDRHLRGTHTLEDEPPAHAGDINRQSVRGGAFTFASQGASVALQLVSTVVLARLLGPEAYGVLAMVTAVTAFAGIFRDLGLSTSTIQRAKLTHEQLSALFWINLAAGALLTAIVAGCAPLVAWFYGKPELSNITRTLSFTFFIGGLGTQHGALLARRMQFGRQTVASLGGGLASFLVAVGLAWQGFGYWSLVGSTLCGGATSTILQIALSGWRPGPPGRGGLGPIMRFGASITAFEMVNYFQRNLDNILIGRLWGADSLGLYSRAYQLLMFPIGNLRGPLWTVALPAMSRLQAQPAAYRNYYRRVVALLAFLSMPLIAFLFVTSDGVIAVVLGAQWASVSPIFSRLALTAFVQPVVSLAGLVCLSLGMGRRYFQLGASNAIVVSLGFLIGVRWGAEGIATAYAIVTYLGMLPITAWAFHRTPLCLRDFVHGVCRPAGASLVAALCIWGMRVAGANSDALVMMATTAPVFAVVYLGLIRLLPGGMEEVTQGLAIARALLGRKH